MLLVGQSLQLHREPFAASLAARDGAALLAQALRQREAGAQAIDLNFGIEGRAIDMAWLAGVLRAPLYGVPLWLDAGSATALALALELCEREGVHGPLVANALPAGGPAGSEETALLRAVARSRAGLVISPRLVDRGGRAVDEPDWVLHEAAEAALRARGGGVTGAIYLDALAWPVTVDPAGARRSLDLLRRYAGVPGVTPLAAAGNVSHGLAREAGAAVRRVYAAAAIGAGAGVLLLPVEDAALVRTVRVAAGEAPPAFEDERYLASVAQAARAAAEWPQPSGRVGAALAEAARMLFEGEAPEVE